MRKSAGDVSLATLKRLARMERARLCKQHRARLFDDMPLMYALCRRYRDTRDIVDVMRLLFRQDVYAELGQTFLPLYEDVGDGQLPFLDAAFSRARGEIGRLELFRSLLLEVAVHEEDADIRKDIILVASKVFAATHFPKKLRGAVQLLYRGLFEIQPLSKVRVVEEIDKIRHTLGAFVVFMH